MRGRKFDKLAANEVFGCIPHGRGAYLDLMGDLSWMSLK